MRRLGVLAAALIAAFAQFAPHALATPTLQIVSQNPSYLTLAVDHAGVGYGEPLPVNGLYGNALYRSTDEGQTWTHLYDFPSGSHLDNLTVLSDDTLIAHVDTGSMTLYRSADGGSTWTRGLVMPTSPVFYTTLTAHSVTDLVTNDSRYVFAGSYNTGDAGNHTNYIWRSGDNGATWALVYLSTSHRHIHFIQADPYAKVLYVGYGDSGSQVSIERSIDQGVTWTPICSGDPCTAVDMAFDPSGFAVYGQDHPFSTSYIEKLDLATGTPTQITKLPGPAYSALHLSPSVWLVGESHEPNMSDDGNVHLFASDDSAHSFVEIANWPYASAGSYARLIVQFAYPNGDFSIRIDGYGTIVGRMVTTAPPDFSLTASPSSRTVAAGAASTYTASVSGTGGFAGTVSLSVSGLPGGATGTFAPTSVTGTDSSTLSIATSASTPPGSYTLTISGSSGSITHTTTVGLTVTTAPDFSLSASPASRSISAGSSGSYTVSVAVVGGFSGAVSLSAAGLPAGATASFSPLTVTGAGNSTLSVSTGAATPTGTYTLTISGASGSTTHTTSVTLTVTPAPDFSLSASPSARSVSAGTTTGYTVTVTTLGGFAGTVSLSVSGLPGGATASFAPGSVTGTDTSTLTVATTAATPPGNYTLTITGSSGGTTHSTTVTLTVTTAPDFSLSASPASRSISAGSSGSYTVSVAVVGGFSGAVSLSLSGLPAGATASFSPLTVTGAGNSTLSVSTGAATPTGTYTLTISGASGSTTHTTTVTLTVAAAPGGGGGGGGGPATAFTVTASPASQSITAGGAGASYSVTIGPSGGFSGTVSLSASGLPAGATASFSPASVGGTGSSTLTVLSTRTTPPGTYSLTITAVSGGTTRSTTVVFAVGPAPDFAVHATPTMHRASHGHPAAFGIAIDDVVGLTGDVELSVARLPAGVTASFATATVSGPGSTTLIVRVGAHAHAGRYALTVTASAAGVSHSVTLTLVVLRAPNFALRVAGSTQTVSAGGTAAYMISETRIGGFTGTVAFAVSGVPRGTSATFSQHSTGGSRTWTLTLRTTAAIPPGRYTITITATSGKLRHTTTITLVVRHR